MVEPAEIKDENGNVYQIDLMHLTQPSRNNRVYSEEALIEMRKQIQNLPKVELFNEEDN